MKKYFFIKLFVMILFLIAGYMICDLSKYYFPTVTYGKNEMRMVIDNVEVTKSLPQEALVENGQVFLSFETVKKYFDPYLYFDEKYHTVIMTNQENIMKLPLDDKTIDYNGEEQLIEYPATKSGDVIYLPMKDTQEMLGVEVVYNEKVIVTTKNVNYITVKMPVKGKVKLYRKELSGTTGKYSPEDILTVYPSGEEEYVKVRTPNGSLGYVKADLIKQGSVVTHYQVSQKDDNIKRKINLTWEYAENFTPDRSSESKITGLNVISPTWIYMKNSSGEVKNTISNSYISWAKQRGYELWPTVKNDSMGLEGTSALVTDMQARERFINGVVELAKKNGFQGINIDFENMKKEDKNAFSEFVREFSATCRRNNLVVSIDVTVPDGSDTWSLCYDRTALGACVDYMILMAYDQYGRGQDGPVASLSWVDANIKKMLEQEKVPANKLILGVPFYSKYRRNRETQSGDDIISENITSQSMSMESAKALLHSNRYQNAYRWDELMGQYYIEYRNGNQVEKAWIEEEKALEQKVKLVDKYHLTGVASWRRGFETNEAWSVIQKNIEGL